ncbi:MAG: efflux RND transporter periplasmic adaptor subunit [Kiritimatiellia bacterium]
MSIRALCALLCAAPLLPAVAQQEPARYSGIAAAIYDASLGISYPGLVEDRVVSLGARVRKGDVLLQLEDTAEDYEVKRRKLMLEDKSELNAAAHRRETLRQEYEVSRRLYESTKSVSREELEKRELESRIATADHEKLQVIEQREEIELRMAEDQFARRKVLAPVDGVVTHLFVERGEYVKVEQPVLRLVNTDECHFICNVPSTETARFKEGAALPLEFNLPSGRVEIPGKVVFVSPIIDPASGLREVKLLFPNRDHVVSPGEKGAVLCP